MKNINIKDALDRYWEAVKMGKNPEEAEFIVKLWAESMELHEDAATKTDLTILELKIMQHFRYVYVTGGLIAAICAIPILQNLAK